MMLCQICKTNPATIHIQEILNGETRMSHLCAECAKKKSMFEPFLKNLDLEKLFREMTGEADEKDDSPETEEDQNTHSSVCPSCGCRQDTFGKTGECGCPECYEVFQPLILPELAMMHRGTVHTGRIPPAFGRSAEKIAARMELQKNLQKLKKNLKECIVREEYELAAEVRDRIAELEKKLAEKEVTA